ncbi:UPF0149 family protein [Acinetobacter sp. B10A]|uniref:UPF0149 family protein n=1 Tax=Acinetobacter baretiae TaxID=2605383 RepID=UPI001B3C9342|nr:UPF0149 family protein [Acinetobacter baretiae]MBF7686341.1 UPF0149 family protein [Acinetobacter baretiae]
MQDDITGWSQWNKQFSEIVELSSPSELHGLLTGVVCITEAPTQEQWSLILSTLNVPTLNHEALQLLTEEGEDTAHALSEDDLDYLPMLPDDQNTLQDRVYALADWCAGVVLGFGLASGHIRSDERELIGHLQDVAAVEFDASDNDEDGEESYQELYEFVRLIPVSLAVGRKRKPVLDSSLLKNIHERITEVENNTDANIVNVFSPNRPS